MALPALAQVADLEQRLGLASGSLAGGDLARAQSDLADASALVRLEAGRTWVDYAGDLVTTIPDVIVTVTARAALRSFRNPEGLTMEVLGDYTAQRSQSSGVFLTDEDKSLVRAAVGKSRGMGTIRTPSAYGDNPADTTLWVGDGGAGDFIPWQVDGDPWTRSL